LTEEDGLGIQFYDQKTFVDPAFMEKKVKVIYGVQRVGQTVVVPSGWVYWTVHTVN
jgi:NADH:ubiquinone oxidoreductase subunit